MRIPTSSGIKYAIHTVNSFGMGLNDELDPSMLHDSELSDCENISIEDNTLTNAPGYVQWDNSPQTHTGPYWGGFSFVKANGTLTNIRQRKGLLEYSSNGGETWVTCTLPTTGSPAVTITLSQVQPCFAALNDIVIFTNGVEDVMSSTDGITWVKRTSLPKCKVVVENAKNRLLYLNQTGTGRQFRFDWSDINDPLTIGASSYQLVDPNNNGFVVGAGLTPDGTTLVFKESAVYSVADFVDNGIIDINFIGSAKLINHNTIATTEDSVMWVDWSGDIREYMGGVIRNLSGRITKNGRNNVLRGDLMCAAYYNKKYHYSTQDSTISNDYNSQEFIVYKNILRNDAVQPYAITRNRRYIGMYFIEDAVFASGRDVTIYIGDSRSDTTSGSPAQYVNTVFAFINDFRSEDFIGGLNGGTQDYYFVTKYFTENVSYYSKKYKKFFANIKQLQTANITFEYRFLPYGAWTTTTYESIANQLEFVEGYGFAEGYGFSQDTLGTMFIDINNPEKPRGIQFKISGSTVQDISILSIAYKLAMKHKFK